MFPWSRADFRHHVLRLVREYVSRSWRSCTRSSTSAIQTRFGVTSTPAPRGAGLYLIVDSTSLSIVGEGEWAAAKDGGRGRRGWKTRHLGVDRSGVNVARALTEASVDDATTGITLIEAVDGALGTGDGGCRLRDDRLLRSRRCAWRHRRGSADEDGPRVSTRTAGERS